MADALVGIALDQLKVCIEDEYQSLVGVKKGVEKLQSTLSAIRAGISDAERRKSKEKLVEDWLRKLKVVAYEVDDVLDEWTTSFLRDKKRSPLNFPGHVLMHRRVGGKIREINERLDEISKEKDSYGFQQVPREEIKEKRESSSRGVNEHEIFGRDKEKEDVISKLLSESSQARKDVPMIISIVGMGGVGKTALAQIVYNDNKVKDRFSSLQLWLYVGDNFNAKELIKKIVESASRTKYGGPEDLDSMHCHLDELVSNKRFLLVLDDVWKKNSEAWEQWRHEWEQLSSLLSKGAQGSRIVVTTRDHTVPKRMGTDPDDIYELKALSEDACWQVFTSQAFYKRTGEECSELVGIGKKIVSKCGGLPLATKTIGSVMRYKRREDWDSMSENETWYDQGFPLPALLISYDNLPSHLKPCFLYCSLFRKGEEIVKIDLIKLWMAQGFIITQGEREIEDIGGEYFDDLIDRSLFQDVKMDSYNVNITHCQMHDLVHDLVRYVSNEEYFVLDSQGQVLETPMKARHLSYNSVNWMDSIPADLYKARNLRTVLLPLRTKTIPKKLFHHLTCLRTLDLSDSYYIETLPSSIKHLKHLRYLDLTRCASLCKLPKKMSSLYNLQTLKLNFCWKLRELPKWLIRMATLQSLEIEHMSQVSFYTKGIGRTRSVVFSVHTEHGYSNIEELKRINLKEKLEIRQLEKVASEDEAKSVELAKKQHLKSLTLHCKRMEGEEKIEGIFESLKPSHENLQRLEIDGYYGSKIPSWMQEISLFTKLIEVRFLDCTNIKQLPPLGTLPFLKDLEIRRNKKIKRVGHEFIGDAAVAFPRLEMLKFYHMDEWIEWEMRSIENEQHIIMPCLRRLTIDNCSKLKSWPELGKLPSLEYLKVNRNEVVERVGHELYGHCDGGGDAMGIAFPKLKELHFENMSKWEDWELSVENVQIIMPSLLRLTIGFCLLKSLPECLLSKLESLHTLHIKHCHRLTSLPDKLGQFKSLYTLMIANCSQLSLPTSIGQLKPLKQLSIEWPWTLGSFPYELTQLQSLHTLHFKNCNSVPDLGQLKSLHTLTFDGCGLESLPTSIGQLKSLQVLSIKDCWYLRAFPDGLTQLQSLHTLHIKDCFALRMPSLSVASKEGGGENWQKIKHIPSIIIDNEIILKRMDETKDH